MSNMLWVLLRSSHPSLPTDLSPRVRPLLSHSTQLPHNMLLMPPLLSTLSTPQSTMLFTLLQLLPTPSMPQFTTLSMLLQLLLMLSMLLQLMPPQLSRPQLTMPQSRLDMLLMTLLSSPPTPSPTLLPMTTQSLPSMLRSSPMVPAMLLDPTLLLFQMAESNMSSTPPTVMMVSLLMSPMRELLSTQRSQLTRLPQPQLTTLNLI